MRLSNLVKLRNRLKAFSSTNARLALDEVDGQLSQLLNIPQHLAYQDNITDIIRHLDSAGQQLTEVDNKLPKIIEEIEKEINDITKEYLQRGYIINGFFGSNSTDVFTEREHRILPINDNTRGEAIVRIRNYTSWKYPTLEIGPGDGAWTEHLVAGDPLYLVEVHKEFIDSTLSKFNPTYRNRLRPYLLKSHDGEPAFDLSELPQNQMGFVFAWNVFNYFPLKETTAYLKEIYNVLRPGGVALFTFNNCEFPQCAEYVESGFRSWMPATLLEDTCKSLGFEIIVIRNIEETVHWIEIKKPGELKTVKGHQVLGKIINVNGNIPIDT